jgi:membrane peptidoglycan carboxypeptidase
VTTPGRVAEREPGDTRPDLSRPRGGRRRRWGRRVAVCLAVACLVVFAGAAVAYAVTPPVSGAWALVREQDAVHHVRGVSGPVPARFAGALVATEDHRFYTEPGIDPIALARLAVGGPEQGGSTLPVQLAKMLYTPASNRIPAKAERAVLGVKLAMSYSKSDILRMYASVVNFGNGYYGLNTASCGYFGVQPRALSLGQAAVLAGLVQAPSADDPVQHPAQAGAREQHVLDRMVATGRITARQARAALAAPLHLDAGNPGAGCR